MDLKLPLVISRQGGRLMRCWLPHWPMVAGEGVSLSELKDDLALMVMERFEGAQPAEAWRYQMAPHLKLKHVKLDTVARNWAPRVPVRLRNSTGKLAGFHG